MATVNIDFAKHGMSLIIGRKFWFIVTEQKNLTDKFLDTLTEKLGHVPSEGNRETLRYYLRKGDVLEHRTICKYLEEDESYYYVYGKNHGGGYDIEEVTIVEFSK